MSAETYAGPRADTVSHTVVYPGGPPRSMPVLYDVVWHTDGTMVPLLEKVSAPFTIRGLDVRGQYHFAVRRSALGAYP